MAREENVWERRRRREEEEEREAQERLEKKKSAGLATGPELSEELLKRFDELVRRAPITIDQLEHLYRQYAVGVLQRPPVEERGRLDQIMTALMNMPKPTPADRFRFSSVWQTYTTHKNRWDKLLADVESGKIKRVAGPKRR